MESTATDPFSKIISTLLKPLIFASKDNFAHLSAIKNIELLTQNLCHQALRLSISDSNIGRVTEKKKKKKERNKKKNGKGGRLFFSFPFFSRGGRKKNPQKFFLVFSAPFQIL